jgi:hypothetical protein
MVPHFNDRVKYSQYDSSLIKVAKNWAILYFEDKYLDAIFMYSDVSSNSLLRKEQ